MKGWILLYRSICDNLLWNDKPFAKGQAWIDLILLANYDETKKIVRNSVVTVKAGSLHTSLRELGERWGWGKTKVGNFLDLLESEKMITKNEDSGGTVITIENYSDFQDIKNANKDTRKTLVRHSQDTDKKPTYLYKQYKEIKEIKEVYGELDNVILTVKEFERLQEKFPLDYMERIDRLSEYIASKGDKYKSHYATILNWDRREQEQRKAAKRKDKADDRLGFIDEF